MDRVIVVGGGLSGLVCARELHRAGLHAQILEASGRVGGRVATDRREGFLLDHGFQILLDSYPEVRAQVDLKALGVRPFLPGARSWDGRRFVGVYDPLRHPTGLLKTLRSRLASIQDGPKLLRYIRDLRRTPSTELAAGPDRSTAEELESLGLSRSLVEGVFKPFLAGVFLERELATSARLFRFYLRLFATGKAVLPSRGMGAIPDQLAERLPSEAIHLGIRAIRVAPQEVELHDGTIRHPGAVVLATDPWQRDRLRGVDTPSPSALGATTIYFRAPTPPVREPVLLLDGTGEGPVNHAAVLDRVNPACAPPGESLVSATVVGGEEAAAEEEGADERLEEGVRRQLSRWFGERAVGRWGHLATYRIPRAQPFAPPGSIPAQGRSARLEPGVYACGDFHATPSINGAMASGRQAAFAVITDRLGR